MPAASSPTAPDAMTAATATTGSPVHAPASLARGNFELVVRRLADDLAFGSDVSRFVGGGLEYASSRLYQPGDSVRQLDWRLTARTGKPFVKEYEALKRTCVHIVVDTSASMAVASTPLSKHDIAVWTAAGVGLLAQRRMSPVAIIGAGSRHAPMSPSLRASDLWRAIDPLRSPACDEPTTLAARLTRLRAALDRTAMVLVISDLHDPSAMSALRQMGQRHDVAVVHTVDPAEIAPFRAGYFRGEEAETGRSFLGRGSDATTGRVERVRTDLAGAGIASVCLRTDEPFVAPLRRFLAGRAALSRGVR
ncbi:MAG: hypothetical protein RL689_2589 [Planctomycetota bacterium]